MLIKTLFSDKSRSRPPNTNELLSLLTTGPSTREVAAATLRMVLKEQYPTLDIDPDLALVYNPRLEVSDDRITPLPGLAESLTSVLSRQAVSPDPVVYIEGEQFLSVQDEGRDPIHLPVQIDAIGRLINELAPLLFTAFKERQLDYWNEAHGDNKPRWQVFADSLRRVWNVTTVAGWDADDCAMARMLYRYPLSADRAHLDVYKGQPYLIDIDFVQGDQITHMGLMDTVVLIGEHEKSPIILTFSLFGGYEKFGNLAELGKSLPATFALPNSDVTLRWSLFKPSGDFAEAQACALIAFQTEAIDEIGGVEAHIPLEQLSAPKQLKRTLPIIDDLNDDAVSSIRQAHQRIPAWLKSASDTDMAAYSRYLINLARVHTDNHGRSFQDGIAPIRDYARAQLQIQLRMHKQGTGVDPDKVEVVIQSPVIWGTFAVPGAIDITRRNLIDLALENLSGLPTGQPSVEYDGAPAPEWLTFNYLTELITQLDIGERYPALIKNTLLANPLQYKSRQLLYSKHLRVQLPLLALQWKIQRHNGLDELGYRYVAAVMQADQHYLPVDGQDIVIRPLAFVPTLRPGTEQDVVANMFVIGPKSPDSGPCLLYCPLLEPVLRQFPSRQNLLYAIKHDPQLRESVLAWLPEEVRFNYEQYVFPNTVPSPWSIARVLIEPATVTYMSGPIVLGNDMLGYGMMDALFKANADAMVELATRQSVSNRQKRWATYRRAGWQIFNAVLPFLGRTVGVAVWIWQIMDDLQTATKALQTPGEPTPWTTLADLWLNLGLALALHVGLRHVPRTQVDTQKLVPLIEAPPLIETKSTVQPAAAKTTVVQMPDLPATAHPGTLHISGALNSSPSSLGITLDSFKLKRPDILPEQKITPGPHQYLYPQEGSWFAPVGERWFEVTVDQNDNVVIVDPALPERLGPTLIHNRAGEWFIDTRLRLRGGGFRNRRLAARSKQPSRIDDLRKQLEAFSLKEPARQKELSDSLAAIGSEPGPSTDTRRQAFVNDADRRLKEYEEPIRQLRALGVIDSVPNYQAMMIAYLKNQLVLNQAIIDEQLPSYRAALLEAMELLDAQNPAAPEVEIPVAQRMTQLNEDLIARLEYTAGRIKVLETLGTEGAKAIQSALRALPNISSLDLKALHISVSRYLCIKPGNSEQLNTLRRQLDVIVNAANLNVQSVVELLILPQDSSLDERIEALNSLTEQFSIVDQRLLDLHADHPEHVLREPLESVRQRIDEFHQRAIRDLAWLLRERKSLEPKPGPSKAVAPPRRKIIKTRFKGVVVGEPRANDAALVDVKAPVTGKVIATFHEKTPGEWVEHHNLGTVAQTPKTIDLEASVKSGQQLLDDLKANTQRLLAHSRRPGHIPVELEEMFHQEAASLKHAASNLETALTQLNLTESSRPSATQLIKKLNDSAQSLYEQGTSTRISMTKQQPPTAARVEWLHSQGQVKIAKAGNRRRLKGPGKDFLDEYEVRDTQNNSVLWYAHFHYATPQAEVEDFTAGHLKTREQQKLGGALQRTGVNDKDQIAVYRSEISPSLAKSLFFQG